MRAAMAIGATLLALCACSGLGGRGPSTLEPRYLVPTLAADVAAAAAGRQVVFHGVREMDGTSASASRSLGELLESELLRSGASLEPLAWEEREQATWQPGSLLPEAWRSHVEALSVGGQVSADGRLSYLRLMVADPVDGTALWTSRTSLSSNRLARLARSMERRARGPGDAAAGPAGDAELAMDLHLVVRRDEEGFTQVVEVGEEGALRQGDRLQIRFRTASDFQVYAFLLASDGERRALSGPDLVYGGRLQYGPSQEGFVTLSQAEKVQTLYVLAAPRLDGLDELHEAIDNLFAQNQVDRFAGLDKVDGAIVSFLERRVEGTTPLAVRRGAAGVESGELERWVYADGQALESRAQVLTGRRALARAISFEVTYP